MDVFSLEDDDCNDLFITQSSNEDINDCNVGCNLQILGKEDDFSAPLSSIVSGSTGNPTVYSDISDDNDFQIPSSQATEAIDRCVNYYFSYLDLMIFMKIIVFKLLIISLFSART